jgi:hypothetical protein
MTLVLLGGLLSAAFSCSGSARGGLPQDGQIGDSTQPSLGLPSPAELPRGVSAGFGDQLLSAPEYATELSSARITVQDQLVLLNPDGQGLADSAYAVYQFNVPGYAGTASVSSFWQDRDPATEYYLGVADYSRNRWVWLQASSDTATVIPDELDFLSPGGVASFVVLCTGTEQHDFLGLRLGCAGIDETEPNETRLQADLLETGEGSFFWGSMADDGVNTFHDWYAFDVEDSNTVYSFELDYSRFGTLTDLRLWDETSLLHSATSHGGSASFDYIIPSAGRYYLECYIRENTQQLPIGEYVLRAWPLGPAPEVTLSVDIPAGVQPQTISLHAEVTLPLGTTVLGYQWDANGDGYYEANTGSQTPDFSTTVYSAGDYDAGVRVEISNGCFGLAACPVSVSGALDEAEPNNSLQDAQALPAAPFSGFFAEMGFGGNEDNVFDYYSFSASAGQTISFDVNYEEELCWPIVSLQGDGFELQDKPLALSADYDGSDTVSYAFTQAGTYFLIVETDGSFFGSSGYSISASVL